MDPITGIGLILSLIPLYQRERDKQKQACKEEFYAWLINHKFQEIKDCITSNLELGTEIENLLRMNQDELLARFDEVDKSLFCIMNSMHEFRSLVKIVAPSARLTEQEEAILKQFVESGENSLFDAATRGNPVNWTTNVSEIIVKDTRFFNANLDRLSKLGYILEKTGSRGNLYYQLTEQAVEYVNNLKKDDLSEQAKSILKQYVESNQQYLCTFLGPQGEINLDAAGPQTKSITTTSPRFIKEDLDALVKKGFIRLDNDMPSGGKSYTLTRDGEEYAKTLKI